MIIFGDAHPDLMEKSESPVIIQFQSVSNDEMDSHCASLSLSMDEVPSLTIDTSSLRPENRASSPLMEALETPTYSYYRMPPLKLDNNHHHSRKTVPNPPSYNFPRPPSRSTNLSFGGPSASDSTNNLFISRANSTDSNYRPFLAEDLQTPEEFPMKRKFSSPQPFLSLNPTNTGYPPQSKRPNYFTTDHNNSQNPFSNHPLFEDSSLPINNHHSDNTNNSSNTFQLPFSFQHDSAMDITTSSSSGNHNHYSQSQSHYNQLPLFPLPSSSGHFPVPSLSSEPTILLRSPLAPDYFFYQNETRREFFNLYDQIGEGVSSDVYQVESRFDPAQNVFALKKLKRTIRTLKQQETALTELRLLYELNQRQCPNLPQLYLVWREEEHLYGLLEYAEHGTIQQLLQYHRQRDFIITIPFVYHVLENVARTLAFIHEQGFVHLDIKAANLLIASNLTIQVTDFGLTIREGQRGDEEGDARYVAKEVLMTSERTYSADLFSFGILLYEMILTVYHTPLVVTDSTTPTTSNRNNNSNSNPSQEILPVDGPLWHQLRSGEISLPSDCPPALARVIQQLMHPTPSRRPTAASLLQLPEVLEVMAHPESYQRDWDHVCFAPPRSLNRTASYDPSMNQSLAK